MFSLPNLICTAQGTVLVIFVFNFYFLCRTITGPVMTKPGDQFFLQRKKKKVKTNEKVKGKLKLNFFLF